MNYFVLTVQYNENFMLPVFLDHYSKFLDPQHIKVVDHGSDNIPPYIDYERIFIPRDRPYSESTRLRIVQHFVSGLLEYYDFGIFVDCDELIDLTNIDKINFETHRIHHVAGFDVFFRQTDDGIRLRGLLNPGMCKPSIFKYMPYWTAGFHEAGEPMSMLHFPMAHTRFLYKQQSIARLDSRISTYETMPGIEIKGGVDIHWKQGSEIMNSFYQYVNTKDNARVVPFHDIDPMAFEDPEIKKLGYRYSADEYDLTDHFPHLLKFTC